MKTRTCFLLVCATSASRIVRQESFAYHITIIFSGEFGKITLNQNVEAAYSVDWIGVSNKPCVEYEGDTPTPTSIVSIKSGGLLVYSRPPFRT